MRFTSHTSLTAYLNEHIHPEFSLGFVPTMGALHQGHLSLMRTALEHCSHLVVSIFVNPTQFDNKQDLEKYPRDLDADVQLLQQHFNDQSLIIYHPNVEDVYGQRPEAKKYDFDGLDLVMEGANRPGHFDGVGTILEFFFNVIRPDKAFFGEKDFQQLQIIRKLVDQLPQNIEIVGCPIERETHGLAMSSRNERLTVAARKEAGFIYKSLRIAADHFRANNITSTLEMVKELYNEQPNLDLEYAVIADESTLQPASSTSPNASYRLFVVAHLEGVRLIDNIPLSKQQSSN
ncbi:pantoate--beta-alanine ligase [Nonlabens xiamenensis]|uniref:pantoate--beta-alanine ligase n=1 Tax=Nonlabens xiamenensis TaxID=2341043 RepID=UPI000F606DC0|nr:pantoate--beta-alanine ligase [Nonlabens xiamenensis]